MPVTVGAGDRTAKSPSKGSLQDVPVFLAKTR
jgi:hypothetical protein